MYKGMKRIFAGLVIGTFSGAALANESAPESPQHNFPVAEQLSSSALIQKRDEYLSERGWQIGDNQQDGGSPFYIGWGESSINVGTGDLAFPDARVAAFEQALLFAKGEFVKSRVQTITSETLSKVRVDDRPFDPATIHDDRSRIGVIADKLAAATEAGLDRLLTELGADPSKLDKKQKRVTASQLLQKSIAVSAVASVSGLRPLVTFEDGGQVGVIVVYSETQRELARSIAAGTAIAQPSKAGKASIGDILKGAIPDDSAYPLQHGIRLIYDDKGNPWLVSFGQAGVKATKQTSKLKMDLLMQGSRQAAGDMARAQIAEFLRGTVNFASQTDFLSESEVAEVTGEAGVEETETVNVGKLVDTQIRQFAEVKIKGVTTLKTWAVNHPDTGHLIVGEVVAWSPLTQAAASGRASVPAATGGGGKSAPSVPVRSGADFESQGSF